MFASAARAPAIRMLNEAEFLVDAVSAQLAEGDDPQISAQVVASSFATISAAAEELKQLDCEGNAVVCFIPQTVAQICRLYGAEDEVRAWAANQIALTPNAFIRAPRKLFNMLDDDSRVLRHQLGLPPKKRPQFDGARKNDSVRYVPTSTDRNILEALADAPTTLAQVEIEQRSGESINSIKRRLPILEKAGLVDRPQGERKGYAITQAGRSEIE